MGAPIKLRIMGHFRVPKPLTFKTRQVQNLSCENEFYLHENKRSFISTTSSHSASLCKGSEHFPSPQLVYNTEEASGVRTRLTPDNVMFVRLTALFRNFTDIGSAM